MPSENKTNEGKFERHAHAVIDVSSRQSKARKMEILMGLMPTRGRLKMLEIGTGSGGIAHYFGTHQELNFQVNAVDVRDNRQITEGYDFNLITGTRLPFEDAFFDVVISNHVIEHVGDAFEQRMHLAELRRVMRDDAIGYLAMPSRWQLVEPHYRLLFLSWFPEKWRSTYLNIRGKGEYYDCRPLTVSELETELGRAGFDFTQHHGEALKLTFSLEMSDSLIYRVLLKHIPEMIYRSLRRCFPTLIYTLRKSQRFQQN